MQIIGNAKKLRIYVSNTDKFKHNLLYEMILYSARRNKLAGATVFKGIMGYGSSSIVHTQKFWEFEEKLPLVIEIIDDPEKIDAFVEKLKPWFEKIPTGCLITVEQAQIMLHKKGRKKGFWDF